MKKLKAKCGHCRGDLYEGKFWIYGSSRKKWCSKEHMAKTVLENIRKSIIKESVSYFELTQLRTFARYIDDNDVLLKEWAGMKEQL